MLAPLPVQCVVVVEDPGGSTIQVHPVPEVVFSVDGPPTPTDTEPSLRVRKRTSSRRTSVDSPVAPKPPPLPGEVGFEGDRVVINLPQWSLPTSSPQSEVDFSIWSQVDGLMFKCHAIRIERDMRAVCSSKAICEQVGMEGFESTGSFVGLYHADPVSQMPWIVAVVASHQGLGAFVVPTVSSGTGIRLQKNGDVLDWLELLESHTIMSFDLPATAFTPDSVVSMQIIFAQFGENGDFKAKPRKENHFALACIPELRDEGPRLGVRPRLLHRVSPLADAQAPTRDHDVLPSKEGGFEVDPSVPTPTALPSRFVTAAWSDDVEWTKSYPDARVVELAMEAALVGLHGPNIFVGDMSKAVDQLDRNLPPEKLAVILENHMKEVELGQVFGPSPMAAFKAMRILPQGAVPKDRYDPSSTRFRSTCDPSALHQFFTQGSINDLTWTPRLLSDHLSAQQIRDTLAWIFMQHGPGVQAYGADIPACFRLMRLHQSMLPLFCYRLEGDDVPNGRAFFTDLCCPFGWTASEWGWQCILALILWRFRVSHIPDMMAFVDNFYNFVHPATGVEFDERRQAIEQVFEELGIPLHERNESPYLFKALGWWWDLAAIDGPPVMVCAEDKFDYIKFKLKVWAVCDRLTLKDYEKIVGILRWLAAGFRVGRAHLGFLMAEAAQHAHAAVAPRSGYVGPPWLRTFAVGEMAKQALLFWARFFPKWDGRCPVFLDFGPKASWEAVGRVDASTDWGCGGWLWIRGQPQAWAFKHKWSKVERERSMRGPDGTRLLRESTTVLEAMAHERWMRVFARMCAGLRVLLEGDNRNVTRAIHRAYSTRPAVMACVHGVCESAARHSVCLRVRWVLGILFNRIADLLSHDRWDQACGAALEEVGVPLTKMR